MATETLDEDPMKRSDELSGLAFRSNGLVKWSLVLAVAGVFVPSCKKNKEPVPITDPATGQVIGHKDPATGKYVFANGMVVTPHRDQPIAPEVMEALAAKMTPKPQWQSPRPPGGGHGASGTRPGGCTAGCWNLREGSFSCTGCCNPVGKDACSCWESCSDYETSRTGPAAR
jgi:hypothetical protein